MTPAKSKSWFTRFAKATAHASGQPSAFMLAVLVVAAWVISGPIFHVALAEKAREGVDDGRSDEGVPEIGELIEQSKPGSKAP